METHNYKCTFVEMYLFMFWCFVMSVFFLELFYYFYSRKEKAEENLKMKKLKLCKCTITQLKAKCTITQAYIVLFMDN